MESPTEPAARSKSRSFLVTIAVLTLALVGVGAWSAGRLFLPTEVAAAPPPTFTLAEGTISSNLSYSASASWPAHAAGTNLAEGIVTTVNVGAGEKVKAGDVLYTVGLRPVIIAEGTIPSFEDLSPGSTGKDVRQFQAMLRSIRLFAGPITGVFDMQTETSVRGWQSRLGANVTGTVAASDVIYVDRLPARVLLDEDIVSRGLPLAGGEKVLSILSSPEFSLVLSDEQAAGVPDNAPVAITSPRGKHWIAVTAGRDRAEDGNVTVSLRAAVTTKPICSAQCGLIPAVGVTALDAEVVLVPPTRGWVVPTAALVSTDGDGAALLDSAGREHAVIIRATAQGQAVVEGSDLHAGEHYRIPSGQ